MKGTLKETWLEKRKIKNSKKGKVTHFVLLKYLTRCSVKELCLEARRNRHFYKNSLHYLCPVSNDINMEKKKKTSHNQV